MKAFLNRFFSSFGGVSDLQSPQPWLFDALGFRTVAGERVSPSNAMALSAVYACINRISSDVMQLPVEFFELKGRNEVPIDDPLEYIFNKIANQDMSGASFKQSMEMVAQGWGNAYAEIQRDEGGRPIAMWPIHPSRIKVIRKPDTRIVYQVYYQQMDLTPEVNRYMEFEQEDIFHIHTMSENGLIGISPIMAGREEMAVGLAAQKLAASFFSNGAKLSGVLEYPGKLDKDVLIRLRASWAEVHNGAEKGNKVAILEQGMKFSPMSISPEASQFLETRKFEVEEVCRRYSMPPFKIGLMDKPVGYNGLEQLSSVYVQDCIVPNCIHWESEITRKFLFDRPMVSARFKVDELRRGDHAARATYMMQRINAGTMTPNEARIMEHENPSPNPALDEFYMQGANKTLTQIANPPPPPAAPGAGPAPKEPDEDDAEEPKKGPAALMGQLPIVEEVFTRVLTKESKVIQNLAQKHADKPAAFVAAVDDAMSDSLAYLGDALKPFCTANRIKVNLGDWSNLMTLRAAADWKTAYTHKEVQTFAAARLHSVPSLAVEMLTIIQESKQ